MSLKDNFSQAVKEILKKDGMVGNDLSKDDNKKTELDRYLEPSAVSAPVEEPQKQQSAPQQAAAPAPEKPQTANTSAESSYAQAQRAAQAEERNYYQQRQQAQTNAAPRGPIDSPYRDVDEQTIISRNTIIEGNIRSFANVTVEGSIKGDVQSTKNANISGKLVGNLDCNNAAMQGSQMQGNIASKGQVKFDRDSLILGNIAAQYLEMNGKVKGNIDVNGKAEFQADAYIIGDITVSTLTVLEGATISGHVNTTFLQDTPSTIFPEMISMTELG